MRHRRWRYQGGTALLLASTLAGVGLLGQGHAAAQQRSPSGSAKKVVIKEVSDRYHFTPTKITISKGTTVTWANRTDVEHNVSAKQNGVKIDKDIEDGKTVRFTFTKPGTYKYHCEYHPYMKGTVIVK